MHYEEFLRSLEKPADHAPADLGPPLEALWYERIGEWDRAHRIVQSQDDSFSAWVHAYLHRREGDRSNARYWYARAGKRESAAPLDQEWEELVRTLVEEHL